MYAVKGGNNTATKTAWQAAHFQEFHGIRVEYAKLTAERKTLNQRYLALKDEVKEAEQLRKSVYNILRREQREQAPRRTQDKELQKGKSAGSSICPPTFI